MSASTSKRYPAELRERAVRMVAEIRSDHESEWAAMTRVAQLLGVGTPETVRKWCRRAEVDAGPAGSHERGIGRAEAAQAGERRAQASQRDLEGGFGFLRGRTRPATALIVAFIDEHVGDRQGDADGHGLRWGVESICAQLSEHGLPRSPPRPTTSTAPAPSPRQVRDAELKPKIAAAHASNYGVYGARKVWLTLNRERDDDEAPIARCTVERLMGEHGLAGAVRGKVKRTTISDPRSPKPRDLVNRNFCRRLRTGSGSPTSPTSRRGRAGATPRSCSTPTPDGSWAGRSRPR